MCGMLNSPAQANREKPNRNCHSHSSCPTTEVRDGDQPPLRLALSTEANGWSPFPEPDCWITNPHKSLSTQDKETKPSLTVACARNVSRTDQHQQHSRQIPFTACTLDYDLLTTKHRLPDKSHRSACPTAQSREPHPHKLNREKATVNCHSHSSCPTTEVRDGDQPPLRLALSTEANGWSPFPEPDCWITKSS